MPGTYQYDLEIKSNVEKLLKDMKQVQDRLDTVEGREYKIKLNVDEKKLSNVISNLEKMLDSLGKGTGDFKQFENLSKELSSIVSEVQSLSKAFGKVDDSGAKTLLSSIQNIDKSLSELSQNILNVNKNMSNMGGNTNGAIKQVENITNESKKAASALEDVAKAQAKVNGQKTNISSGRKDTFPDKDISTSVESATNSIKEENNVLEQNTQKVKENTQAKEQNVNVNLNKYDKRLDSYNGKIDKYKTTIDRFNDGGWTSSTYLENVQAVKDAVRKYEDLLNNIKAKGGIASEDDVQNLKEYESEIKKTISTVTNMSAAEKGYNFVSGQKELDKIHKILDENTRMSSSAKAKIKAYYKEIESGNPSMSLDKIHGEIMKIVNAEKEAGRAGKSMWSAIKEKAWYGAASAIGTYFGVNDIFRYGKEAVQVIRELDDALVDLKKTTAMNNAQLENFYYDSNNIAKQMGVTTQEIIEQASSWSRLGFSTKEASTEMAKLSSQFASISPGMSVDEAQQGIVSIMKAWSLDYDQVKSEILDPINRLGNTMALNNQDIIEGMQRSAAALAAVGTSTKDAFAMFSGVQEVLQNAEKSGTSLRSIALRLRGFDESTEEYSEDLSNITGELVDLTKTTEHSQGISVFKDGSTTEFKELTDYFREIASIWDEMSEKQQNDYLLKAFGRTQAQGGAALIQNFKGVEKALNEVEQSAGSADAEMGIIESSISYKINALKETWVGTVQELVDRGDIGKLVDGLTKLSEGLGFVIDKLGILGSIGLGAGIFAGIKNVGRDKMYSLACFEYADNIHNLLWIHRFRVCYL